MASALQQRRAAYRNTFNSPEGKKVLADLKRFCRALNSSHTPGDPYTTAFLEGRREVWNRILVHINLPDADIVNLKETYTND